MFCKLHIVVNCIVFYIILSAVTSIYDKTIAQRKDTVLSLDSMVGSKNWFPKETYQNVDELKREFYKQLENDSFMKAMYEKYKAEFKKTYSQAQSQTHFVTLKKNLIEIFEHNLLYQAGQSTYEAGINQLTDLRAKNLNQVVAGYSQLLKRKLEIYIFEDKKE